MKFIILLIFLSLSCSSKSNNYSETRICYSADNIAFDIVCVDGKEYLSRHHGGIIPLNKSCKCPHEGEK